MIKNSINHLAIIMDGNGRWAKHKNQPRTFGHKYGAQTAKKIINDCVKKEIPFLTLYTFSKENWSRPTEEIDTLMILLSTMLKNETENMLRNNIKFNIVGRIEDLPEKTRDWVLTTIEKTKNNTGLTLTLALSYGGRQEIVDAFNAIMNKEIKIINEEILKNHLYCPDLPDPDIIIRTGGEYRLSNFLLWQSAYAEIYICQKNWPDFDEKDLEKALEEYENRNRTFGKVYKMKFAKTSILFMCFLSQIFAQQVTLYRVNVEGNTTTSDKMIKYSAGLRDGTQIQRSDISTAITRLWELRLFEDVNIVLNNESQYGVEITIKVSESPILNQVLFEGMTVREGRFREKIDLKSGQRIKPNSVEKATRKISEIYKEDGYYNV